MSLQTRTATGWSIFLDNAPTVFDPAQLDSDGDGIGDAADLTPAIYDPAPPASLSKGSGIMFSGIWHFRCFRICTCFQLSDRIQ